jgi:hypothetical protein
MEERLVVDILASVIPGFRALRTPVTAGVLWIINIVVILVSHRVHIHIKHSMLVTANSLSPNWFGIVALPVILAAAYLVGSVMISLTGSILRKVIDLYRLALTRIALPYRQNMTSRSRDFTRHSWRRRIDRLARRSDLISINANSLLYDYVITALADAGATGTAAMMFPVENLHDKLIQCAAQLSQVAPAQYQEYDRIQAEADFRLAVVPPLLVASCIVPVSYRWFLILGTVIFSLVLIAQSVSLNRKAIDILASAARLGYLEIPEIKSLSSYLTNVDPPPGGDGAWIGAIIIGLNRRGFFDEADALIQESTELDQKSDVAQLMSYLESYDDEVGEQFKRAFLKNRGTEVYDFKGTGA